MESSNVKWSKASFPIFSSSLTAAEITRLLAIKPTRSHEAGEVVSSRRKSPVRTEAAWLLESGVDDRESMDRHQSRF
ncbi:MAG: DUF4279 domain-containing protein [Actinomycetota bacterium]